MAKRYLKFTPEAEIDLDIERGVKEQTGIVVLDNISDEEVVFKFRSTNPVDMTLTPPIGVVGPLAKKTIDILYENTKPKHGGREHLKVYVAPVDAQYQSDHDILALIERLGNKWHEDQRYRVKYHSERGKEPEGNSEYLTSGATEYYTQIERGPAVVVHDRPESMHHGQDQHPEPKDQSHHYRTHTPLIDKSDGRQSYHVAPILSPESGPKHEPTSPKVSRPPRRFSYKSGPPLTSPRSAPVAVHHPPHRTDRGATMPLPLPRTVKEPTHAPESSQHASKSYKSVSVANPLQEQHSDHKTPQRFVEKMPMENDPKVPHYHLGLESDHHKPSLGRKVYSRFSSLGDGLRNLKADVQQLRESENRSKLVFGAVLLLAVVLLVFLVGLPLVRQYRGRHHHHLPNGGNVVHTLVDYMGDAATEVGDTYIENRDMTIDEYIHSKMS